MTLHCVLALTFSGLALYAQPASIRGRVLDPSSAAVPGASVSVYSRDGSFKRSTVASSSGEFLITGLPASTYLMEASAPGLASEAPLHIPLSPGAAGQRDITLSLPRAISRIVVISSATAETSEQAAKAFDIIDGAEIERRKEFSAVEALRLTPGVRVMQLGGPGSLARIHTRGLRAFDSSLLIDGFRFRDMGSTQADATGFLGDFLLFDTDRVEVLRGSGSSLYGTNAIGGVINVVSNQGGGPLHSDLTIEGGGLGLFRGAARIAGAAFEERLQYSAGVTHLNLSKGIDGNDAYHNSSLQGHAQLRLARASSISGRIFANDAFTQVNTSPFAPAPAQLPATIPVPAAAGRTFTPAADDPDARRNSGFLSTLLTYNRQISGAAVLRVHYQGMSTGRDHRDGPGGPRFQPRFNTLGRFDGRIDTVQARTDASIGAHHLLSAGYEFERETFDNLSTDENPDPTAQVSARAQVNQRSHAIFAQEQLTAGNLRVSLSGRVQNFRLSRPEFAGGAPRYQNAAIPKPPVAYTGDAAISYRIGATGTKIRAHGGNGFRIPSLYERYGASFFLGSFSPYGDPRLSPERSIGFDGGFDQYLGGARVRLSGTYFYTRLQQVIEFDFSGLISPASDPYGRFSGFRNTGGGLARGMEWSLEAHPWRGARLNAGYTYTKAQERVSALLGGSVRSIRVSNHMFTTTATQTIAKSVDVTFDLFAASNYLYPLFTGGSRPFQFDGPVKADLSVNYRRMLGERRSADFFVRVENVFNRAYFEDGFAGPKAWAAGGVKFRF